jgi:hypothetical protein
MEVTKMKKKLFAIPLTIGMISMGSWSMISPVYAAQCQSQANYPPISRSIVDDDQETNDDQKEVEYGSHSKIERHGAANLPGGGHADRDGANVEHQFEGEE